MYSQCVLCYVNIRNKQTKQFLSYFRYILHAKKTGFVVEHDFIMATYLADRVIVFEGKPSVDTTAHTPQSLLNGMNRFLELLEITFRRDPNNFRPRINKTNSVKVGSESGVFFSIEKHKLNYFLSIHRIRSRSAQVNTSSTKSLKFHRARTFRSLFNWY